MLPTETVRSDKTDAELRTKASGWQAVSVSKRGVRTYATLRLSGSIAQAPLQQQRTSEEAHAQVDELLHMSDTGFSFSETLEATTQQAQ